MSNDATSDDLARGAVANSFLELDSQLAADPAFQNLVESATSVAIETGKRLNVPPVLVAQCLFNRVAKATRDIKPAA